MLIYDGKIKFEYHDTGHRYTVSKKVEDVWLEPETVVGVTTITGVIAKEALIGWASKEASSYVLSHLKDLKDLKVVCEEAKNAFRKKSDAGKRAGSVGHALVEALLRGQEVKMPTDPDALKQAESVKKAFETWREDFAPVIIDVELPVYSLKHNFAGKFDLLCEIGGKVTIVDFKTTNPSYYNPDGIYAENFAQLGAYSIGAEEMLDREIEQLLIVNLPKDGNEYRVKGLDDLGVSKLDAKLYFLNCLALYNNHKLFEWRQSK